MDVNGVFFDGEQRLRSGWRVAVFIIQYAVLAAIVATIAASFLAVAGAEPPTGPHAFAYTSIVALVPATIAGWLCGRWLESLPIAALGVSLSLKALRNFAFGILLGAASLALAVALAAMLADYRIVPNTEHSAAEIARTAAWSFGIYAAGAAFEEAFFRGYLFQTLTRAGYAWVAIVLTAVVFGVVHLGNPNAGVISTIDTVFAGVVFSVAYLKTRDLWFPFGIHLMWNWMQGSFFGIEVSGLTAMSPIPVLKEIDGGPVWLTGGDYGIEGGIASTAALLVTIAAIYFIPFKPPTSSVS